MTLSSSFKLRRTIRTASDSNVESRGDRGGRSRRETCYQWALAELSTAAWIPWGTSARARSWTYGGRERKDSYRLVSKAAPVRSHSSATDPVGYGCFSTTSRTSLFVWPLVAQEITVER